MTLEILRGDRSSIDPAVPVIEPARRVPKRDFLVSTLAEMVARAKAHYAAGQMRDAERLCLNVLLKDASDFEAHLLLGAVYYAQGKPNEAVASFTQATQLRPDHAEAHSDLGAVLESRGVLDRAAVCFRRALELKPGLVEAHNGLGVVLAKSGKLDEAIASFQHACRLNPRAEDAAKNLRFTMALRERRLGSGLAEQGNLDAALACYRRAIELDPNDAEAQNGLGAVLDRQGNQAAAIAYYRRATELKPDFAVAHSNLGNLFWKKGDLDAAGECYRRSVELKPEDAEAQSGLGAVCEGLGNLDAAAACYRRALELRPNYAVAQSNLGGVFWKKGDIEAAADCYRRALELKPDFAEAHSNLGAMLERQGDPGQAIVCYRRAIEFMPEHVEAHFNLAHALLQTGHFAEGWLEYEWRWKQAGISEPAPVPLRPRWTGSALAGRTILLRSEQGMGDHLHFVRYAELLKQRGAMVAVECPPPVASLLATCSGVDRVVAAGQPLGDFDVYLPLLSVPRILETSLDNIPGEVPYLRPNAQLIEIWKEQLAGDGAFRIGIAWQGSATHKLNHIRSIPLAYFAGIVRMPGVRAYSLQMGPGREQLAAVAEHWPVIDLGDRLGDFENTAAIVQNLDLVITCDSAPAHLAGALGSRVWVALSFGPDWRWMLDRTDSPWYPTMRLFRQSQPGDWQGVFQRIETELAALIAEH